MFLSLICPRPKKPKKNIDTFLQSLTEELKYLWEVGAKTYDINTYQKFNMRVALMWIINDFLTYGMQFGWSTSELLGCLICTENFKTFYLQNGKNISYFECHMQFFPRRHPYRRNRSSFIRGRAMMNHPPPRLMRDEI